MFDPELILSQIASGLVLGGLYVLIAIGLSIIFGLLGIVNFAHGTFFTLGAYFALTLFNTFGWPAVVLSPLIVGGIGMLAERLLIRRLYDKEPLISLIVTFALALLIEASVRLIWGGIGQPLSPPPFLSGFLIWGPLLMTNYRLAVLGMTAAVLVGLWAFLTYTPFGRILRAGSRDPEMVGLLGINLPRVLTWVFGLGCCISGIAGVLAAPLWTITPAMATNAIMPAFVVVAIGGLGSFPGAVIAGLMVGVVIALTIQFWPAASGAIMYLFMALMLLLRPRGLLGERWERFDRSPRASDPLDHRRARHSHGGVGGDRRADRTDHANRDLHAVRRGREPAGWLHRSGAVRRVGVLRLCQLCRGDSHAHVPRQRGRGADLRRAVSLILATVLASIILRRRGLSISRC